MPERALERSELIAALREFNNPLSHLDENQISNLLNVWRNNVRLYQGFTPRRYTGKMVLFAATRGRTSQSPTTESWRAHVEGVIECHDVDCEHDDMMEPVPLREIGHILAAEIKLADSDHV